MPVPFSNARSSMERQNEKKNEQKKYIYVYILCFTLSNNDILRCGLSLRLAPCRDDLYRDSAIFELFILTTKSNIAVAIYLAQYL